MMNLLLECVLGRWYDVIFERLWIVEVTLFNLKWGTNFIFSLNSVQTSAIFGMKNV